jgi:tetratricopeptide (TPR) repeat protein
MARVFSVFLSSTFRDMVAERTALHADVFPALARLCADEGYQFRAIDLRWGVAEAAQRSQQTMPICREEIDRCRAAGDGPFFVALIGDRHGWAPLPASIEAGEFEAVLERVRDADMRRTIDTWYQIDENAVPRARLLKASDDMPVTSWLELEERMVAALRLAVADLSLSAEARHKYFASATEQEILFALREPGVPAGRAFAFVRSLPQTPPGHSRPEDFVDDPSQGGGAERMKALVRRQLACSTHEFQAGWTAHGITEGHIPALCRAVEDTLARAILAAIERQKDVDALDEEMAAHADFARACGRDLVGRTDELAMVERLLADDAGGTLVFLGSPGVGRSAIMAAALGVIARVRPAADVYTRFIGTTAESSHGQPLLTSLCAQLARFRGLSPPDDTVPYHVAVEWFGRALGAATALRPIVLVLDGLERLSHGPMTHLPRWLPPVLPPHVWLLLSTAEGLHGAELRGHLPSALFEEVLPLESAECGALLDIRLRQLGRTLRPAQRASVMDAFERSGRPLWLDLVIRRVAGWSSDDAPGELTSGIGNAAFELYRELGSAARHGPVLVGTALGLLAASESGLTETELLDLLSSDPAVKEDFRERNPLAPETDRLPDLVWSRLRLDLGQFLTWRQVTEAEVLCYGHRILGEVSAQIFLGGRRESHVRDQLIAYFDHLPPFRAKDGVERPTFRAVAEVLHQLRALRDWDSLKTLLKRPRHFEALAGVASSGLSEAWSELRRYADLDPGQFFAETIASPADQSDYARSVAIFLKSVGSPEEGFEILRRLVDQHQGEPTYDFAFDVGNAVDLCRMLEQLELGLSFSDRAIAAYMSLGNLREVARALGNRAAILTELGQPRAALALHAREERIFRFLEDRAALGICLGMQSMAWRALEDLDRSLEVVQQALGILAQEGSREMTSFMLQAIPLLHARGRFFEALVMNREAEKRFLGFGDLRGLEIALALRITAYVALGEPAQALRLVDGGHAWVCGRLGMAELVARNAALGAAIERWQGRSVESKGRLLQGVLRSEDPALVSKEFRGMSEVVSAYAPSSTVGWTRWGLLGLIRRLRVRILGRR